MSEASLDDDCLLCEMCNEPYSKDNEVLGGRNGRSGFCCYECKQEADDEIRVADYEACEQLLLYGDDIDSWCR